MERRLFNACCKGNITLVRSILLPSFGRRLTSQQIRLINKFRDGPLHLPILHLACVWNSGSLLDLLRDVGLDLHVRNLFGDTALHFAALFNKHKAVEKLIQLGADINALNCWKATPLHYSTSTAVQYKMYASLDVLVEHGAEILQDNTGISPLDLVCWTDREDLVDRLLKNRSLAQAQGNVATLTRLLCRSYPRNDHRCLQMAVRLLQHMRDPQLTYKLLDSVIRQQPAPVDEDVSVAYKNITLVLKNKSYLLPDGPHSLANVEIILFSLDSTRQDSLKTLLRGNSDKDSS